MTLLPQMEKDLCVTEKATNAETLIHIHNVAQLLCTVQKNLMVRSMNHDRSKLSGIELDTFTKFTPKLRETVYGSDNYKQFLQEMKPTLDNHYAKNSHHPEHYKNGIDGMSLLDLIEMIVDWKASSLRTKDGCIKKSLKIQKERFNIGDQLYTILENTVKELDL